jgi:prevent-host-death family protein
MKVSLPRDRGVLEMKAFTASDARRRFGRLMETAQREPVTITKNGRAAAIMVSASDNELIAAVEGFLEERYWGERVADAERGGYIGARESNSILSEALSAEG